MIVSEAIVTSNPTPKQFRVLVVTASTEDHITAFCVRLSSECPNLEIQRWIPSDSSVNNSTFVVEVSTEAKKQQAHFVLIDENLIEHRRDFYRTLQKQLHPAYCILLVSHEIKTYRVIDTVLTRTIPINIYQELEANVIVDLRSILIDELLHDHISVVNINNGDLLRVEVEAANFSHREVIELLDVFFARDQQIWLRKVDGFANTAASVRPRSIVLEVRSSKRIAVIIKIARKERIEQEAKRYEHYIEGKLVGLRYARIERSLPLWEIGGIVYTLIGAPLDKDGSSSLKSLHSFAARYTTAQDDAKIRQLEDALEHLFNEVWKLLYRTTSESYPLPVPPLFFQYSEVWSKPDNQDSWVQKFERAFSPENKLAQPPFHHFRPPLPHPLPNPLHWAWRRRNESNLGCDRRAVTHGDLHGDNFLLDDQNKCWLIDFERSGPGPILQDFVELEVDIVTRLTDFVPDGLLLLYELALVIISPDFANPSAEQVLWPKHFSGELNKTLRVIEKLRLLAASVVGKWSEEEYLWGLLMNTLFIAEITHERLSYKPEMMRQENALMFGGVICERLEQLSIQGRNEETAVWPPPSWLPLRNGINSE